MTFFSICIILGAVHVSLHSGESVIPVSGEEGSTALLNCKLPSLDTETHIRWSTKSEIVFERKGDKFYQGEGYEDRVDVPEEELRKGTCSLVLRNLTPNDKNVYTCSYKVKRSKRDTLVKAEFKEISRVSLSVREKPPEEKSDEVSSLTGLHSGESVIPVSGEEGSTALLNCKLPSLDTETHIRWSTKSEIVFERKGDKFYQGEGYEDRVDVPEEELRKGTCSLVLRNLTPNDKNVYTCSYKVKRSKRDTLVKAEFKEISRVSLSVREKPPEEKSDEVSSLTDDAQMKNPHPLILVLSLLACVLFQYFLREP